MQLAEDRTAPAIDADGFAAAMAAFAPFEAPPRLAVAVSGGPDSTALALLADAWARARGGDVLALIVDHRLRADSAEEAARVVGRLAQRGIAGEVLVWRRAADDKRSQAAAREARYALLHAACARHGRRHLLLGHSRDDQAETVLLRLEKGSGIDGLAGMTALREDRGLRLLRPLLAFPKSALTATCRAHGVAWEDDPSNLSPAYARGALRARWPALAAGGLTPEVLLDTAARAGAARVARDRDTAALLDRAAILHPEGWAELDRDALRKAPGEIADRALARVLRSVGGAGYGPRRATLARLTAEMLAPTAPVAGRTLAGCRILSRGDGRRLVVGREIAAAERRRCQAEETATTILWDRRFRVDLAVPATLLDGATLGPLGAAPPPGRCRRRSAVCRRSPDTGCRPCGATARSSPCPSATVGRTPQRGRCPAPCASPSSRTNRCNRHPLSRRRRSAGCLWTRRHYLGRTKIGLPRVRWPPGCRTDHPRDAVRSTPATTAGTPRRIGARMPPAGRRR